MAHVTIRNKKDFQFNPKLSVDEFKGEPAVLFGKEVLFRDDYWLRNVHVKITDTCNATCNFCVEKNSNIKEDKDNLLKNLSSLFEQMNAQGLLATVSITGGEPTLCKHLPEVLELISKYNVFSSLNTTGRNIKQLSNAPDWINISKHYFSDETIFGLKNLSIKDIERIRENTGSKIRIQGVLLPGYLDSLPKVIKFIQTYKHVVDDFGFRQLIKDDARSDYVSLLQLRKYLYNYADFVEQVIQDYYVYETWTLDGKDITLSMSDMGMLVANEQIEDASHLREVVVHPDGLVSGDWNRETKILKR